MCLPRLIGHQMLQLLVLLPKLVLLRGANPIDFDIRTFDGAEYENTDPAGYDPLEWVSLQLYVYR